MLTEEIVDYVPVEFNDKYRIYPDGRCMSLWSMQYLAKIMIKDNGKEYPSYNIRHKGNPKKKHTVARLVYYHYGLHDAKSYEDLKGDVTYVDGDTTNCHIDNLILVSRARLLKLHGIKPICKDFIELVSKIKSSEVDTVKQMLLEGKTRTYIARIYNVNAMSVKRFIDRHNIIYGGESREQ
jgi:hypothetical protein